MIYVVAAGAACGLAASLPLAFMFEKTLLLGTREEIAAVQVFLALGASFLLQTLALLVVYVARAEAVLVFGGAMVATFLAFWGVESVRAWRAANAAGGARRKDKE